MSSTVAGGNPGKGTPPAAPIVIVGVDGSEASKDALRWAAGYARHIGAKLRAVTAWEWPVSMGMAMPLPEEYDPSKDAGGALQLALKEVLGDAPDLPITTAVVEGAAAGVLVRAAVDASLLVVGSRGHGGFAGLLLGSVSEHCARHAACPVVIMRHRREGTP